MRNYRIIAERVCKQTHLKKKKEKKKISLRVLNICNEKKVNLKTTKEIPLKYVREM